MKYLINIIGGFIIGTAITWVVAKIYLSVASESVKENPLTFIALVLCWFVVMGVCTGIISFATRSK